MTPSNIIIIAASCLTIFFSGMTIYNVHETQKILESINDQR